MASELLLVFSIIAKRVQFVFVLQHNRGQHDTGIVFCRSLRLQLDLHSKSFEAVLIK